MLTQSLVISAACSFGAFCLAGWSFATGLGERGLPGCAAGSGCHEVTNGRWSRLGWVPVALIGAAVYGAMTVTIVLSFLHLLNAESPGAVFLLSTMACSFLGAAAWFSLLQGVVIHRWCFYCLLTHLLAFAAAISVLWHLWPQNLIMACASGMGLVAMLIVGQIFVRSRRYAITIMPNVVPHPSEQPIPTYGPAIAEIPPATALAHHSRVHREVILAGGRVKIDLYDFPLLGSPQAEHIFAALVDFTCSECHHLHRILREAIARYPNHIAVAIIPIPLHEGCNQTVKCHNVDQAYACSFTRLAWHVWSLNPAAYALWDEFLSQPAENQPYGLGLLRARELVELGEFKPGEPDIFADERIAKSIELHQAATNPRVPAVLLKQSILTGHVEDLDHLLSLIQPELKLPG